MAETLLTVAVATLIVCAGAGLLAAGAFWLWQRQRPAAVLGPDTELAELAKLQNETAVRVQAMADMLAGRQADLARHVNERLDAVTQHLGVSVQNASKHTVENLQKLNERLAVIDHAQKNITELASQVTSLQTVLSNKQSRGAFGQGRMEAIVQDGLPKGAYEFQYTLKNGRRPDCCVFLPDKRPLVIDAKFPLEGFTAYREAKTDDERKLAAQRLRQDVGKHISDIAERYLVPGETHDLALMFVPSESLYADLHDGFDDLVQRAFRARVMVVSPSLLMLAIQVVQQIQKDARMREAADQIRDEVGKLLKDVGLLGDRVRKLQAHLSQSNEDIRQALISVDKIEKRGDQIRDVEFEGEPDLLEQASNVIPAPVRKVQAGEF